METRKTDSDKQFLTEVFPKELHEILIRQERVFNKSNENIKKVVRADEQYKKVCMELEKAKKSPGICQYIARFTQEYFKIDLLKKFGFSQTIQYPEETLRQLEKQEQDAKKLLETHSKPSTDLSLVGLALSGGGIRSATFNLGVLQVLSERGILKYVDYLSTVSGGGYIGSCLSSVLNNPEIGPEKDKFPFRHQKGIPEPEAMKHLRNYGNFIAPNGIIDWLKIPALFLRGAMINLCLLLPYVYVFVLLTLGIYYSQLQSVYEIKESSLIELKSKEVPPNILNRLKELNNLRLTSEKEVSLFLKTRLNNEKDVTLKPLILNHIKKVSPRKSFYYVTPWVGIAFLGYCVLFLFLQSFFSSKYERRTGYGVSFGYALLAVITFAILESIPTALSYYLILDLDKVKTAVAAIIPFVFSVFAGKAAEKVQRRSGQIAMYLLGALGPFIVFIIYAILCKWMLESYTEHIYCLTIIIFVIFIITRVFTDVNVTSFHNFYRDQLSKAFLFQTHGGKSNVEHHDEQKLSALNKDSTQAPYHLVNVTLNLQGSKDKSLRDRHADFFIFSKHFCGSIRTGFCKTKVLEGNDPHLNLGTAMAISGAAASPNMGTVTIKPLVFIMTLLNIRLGYWLLNPYKLKDTEKENRLVHSLEYWKYSPFTGVGPYYLFKEIFGKVREHSKYVNITDGGHIENLAIFELLRRKCKYIIACDAEADPDMTFGGLAKLIRYARTDLSIEIEIDLDDVRKGENGFSHSHCAFGKIDYGNGEIGYLLYIKSSMTGDENEYIREYRSNREDFPHESTADQFFDEAQFEAYRALGYHIVNTLEGWKELEKDKGLDKWFEFQEMALPPRYRMEDKFVNLQVQLSEIEKIYQDPDISEYTYQIYPELLCNKTNTNVGEKKVDTSSDAVSNRVSVLSFGDIRVGKECFRKIFHFCNQQMQLMENVFVAIQLDKPYNRDHHINRGWINLFRRWAEAPFFRWSWAVSIGTYSLGFQMFCEDVLKLHRIVRCRFGREDDLTLQEVDCLIQRKNTVNFFDENRKLLPQYQIWIAEMSVCITDIQWQSESSFPVGFIIVESMPKIGENTYHINLRHYQIRNIYRQMRLLEKMVLDLMDTIRKAYGVRTEFCVIFETEKNKSRYGYFFERYGCEVKYMPEDVQ